MFFENFTTQEEALERLLADKDPECQDRLESYFLQAVGDGLSLSHAIEKTILCHAQKDHGAGEAPEGFPYTYDAEIEQAFADALKESDSDGRAQERIDLAIGTFRRFRTYDLSLYYASETSCLWAREKWVRDTLLSDISNLLSGPDDINEPD